MPQLRGERVEKNTGNAVRMAIGRREVGISAWSGGGHAGVKRERKRFDRCFRDTADSESRRGRRQGYHVVHPGGHRGTDRERDGHDLRVSGCVVDSDETEIVTAPRPGAGLECGQTDEVVVRDVRVRVTREVTGELSGQGIGVVNLEIVSDSNVRG